MPSDKYQQKKLEKCSLFSLSLSSSCHFLNFRRHECYSQMCTLQPNSYECFSFLDWKQYRRELDLDIMPIFLTVSLFWAAEVLNYSQLRHELCSSCEGYSSTTWMFLYTSSYLNMVCSWKGFFFKITHSFFQFFFQKNVTSGKFLISSFFLICYLLYFWVIFFKYESSLLHIHFHSLYCFIISWNCCY